MKLINHFFNVIHYAFILCNAIKICDGSINEICKENEIFFLIAAQNLSSWCLLIMRNYNLFFGAEIRK